MQCKKAEIALGKPQTVNIYSEKKKGKKDQFVKLGVGDLRFDVNVFFAVKHFNAAFSESRKVYVLGFLC